MSKDMNQKDFIRDFTSKYMKELIERIGDVVTTIHEHYAKEIIGPLNKRIGVFGPYPADGKFFIDLISQKIASLGLASLTGEGYYLPEDPTDRKNIKDISPPEIRKLFTTDPMKELQYFYLFPRMVSKAIFYMNDERGQIHELRGCYDYSIPFIGFILSNDISKKEGDCGHLKQKEGYVECIVPDFELCALRMHDKPFCPFHDYVNISWLSLELFLKRRFGQRPNRLIAVQDFYGMEQLLTSCIEEHKDKYFNEKPEENKSVQHQKAKTIL